ncbi:hypothetical protein CDAR_316551 [Caerostris darwini]|uniref:Uncharacterized protein n=1 Tax=Caerostris darwini TaxID=1538125 RepID=A0AAV4UJF0_9ARAC|nr:hypothetical protein CDAR_316551 [Caerostris darwini]
MAHKRQLLLDLKSDGGNSSHCHHQKKQPLPIQRQIRSGKTAASPFTILIRGLDLHTPRCKNSTPKNGFPHHWQHVCPGNCPDVRTSVPRPFQKGYCRTPGLLDKRRIAGTFERSSVQTRPQGDRSSFDRSDNEYWKDCHIWRWFWLILIRLQQK